MNPRDVILVVMEDGRRIATELQYFSPNSFAVIGAIKAWIVIYPVRKD